MDASFDTSSTSVDRAIAGAGAGITIADATVRGFPLTYVNAGFEALTGYRADECLGRNCHFLQGPGTDPAAVAVLADALAGGHDTRVVLLNHKKDGTPFYNELRLSCVRDADGRVVQVVGVQHDVTKLVEAQRRLEADHARSREELDVLRSLLTPAAVPERPHLDLATAFSPAELGVSGDFHLVAPGPDESTILVVGDAMGHGPDAAGRATFVRTALATFARFTDDPQRLLTMANHSLIEKLGTSADFVTAVCATYDPRALSMRWASAGHPVPLDLDSGAPIGAGEDVGAALGIALDVGGTLGEARLEPGDGILLYTDGLSEARSPPSASAGRSPRLGDAAVRDLLRGVPSRRPDEVVEALRTAAHAHADGPLSDDLCLLAFRTT